MSNRYAGACYRCGEIVQPGEGVFELTGQAHRQKWPGRNPGRWLTQHHECARRFRGTARHYQFAPDAPTTEATEARHDD